MITFLIDLVSFTKAPYSNLQDGSIVIKKMLHVDDIEDKDISNDTQEVSGAAPPGGGGKNYGRQVSIQELFDGDYF